MAMKFPATNEEIITVKADPKEARQCYMQSLKVIPYTLRTTVEGQAAQTVAKPSPMSIPDFVRVKIYFFLLLLFYFIIRNNLCNFVGALITKINKIVFKLN